MDTMLDNYVNGNLTTARKQARRYSTLAIADALRERGYSSDKAWRTAHYLKTGEGWQAACDAK